MLSVALILCACEGDQGPQGPPGPPGGGSGGGSGDEDEPTDDELERGEAVPGIELAVVSLTGASGADGSFQVGDRITVEYSLQKSDGSAWPLAEMDFGRILVSGPTFNYQLVIPELDDLATRSVDVEESVHRYAFEATLPAEYAAPYNDSGDFGALDGELAGQPLLAGTYTVGLSFGWRYTVEGESFVDVDEATVDLLFGGATTLAPREVVTQTNCNRCHVELRAHQGERRELRQCLMCHVSGAEDPNDPDIGAGTPGRSIDSRVLFHKIHDAAHLPSVLGIGVHADGTLDYEREPTPLLVADGNGSLRDFSHVGFPAWPNRTIPMVKDYQYSSLTAEARMKEDAVLRGVTTCRACHGDPDGDGPIEPPAEGDLVYTQPSRKACGACHDDIDWNLDYQTNSQTMPPQPDSSACKTCHEVTGGPLAVRDAHRHPLEDPTFNPGLRLELLSASESGAHDGSGTVDEGEEILVRFTLRDDSGADVDPSVADAIEVVLSGPTKNSQIVLRERIPTAALSGSQPFELALPERIQAEFVGDSTAAGGEVFATSRAPHLDVAEAETVVRARTGAGEHATSLTQAAPERSNFLAVVDEAGFERDDWIVVDDGVLGREEYLRIQFVENRRLWFSSPASPDYPAGLRHDHASGAQVREVELEELEEGVDYALDASAGEITELAELGAGRAVVVSYTSRFRMPATHPAPLNDSPDLGMEWGEWTGKPIARGTYTLSLWAWYEQDLPFAFEHNLYRIASPASTASLLVEGAPEEVPYELISSGSNCQACHQEVMFHGGRDRGFDACIACHGTAGAEDRPRYVSANAPATSGVSVSFRALLHRIHMGMSLDQAESFFAVGEGEAPWPDDFERNGYGTVHFPAMPGGVLQCTKCHGETNEAWIEPAPRDLPQGQDPHVRAWAAVCLGCHDSSAAEAHADSQTSSSGAEACILCHGPGEEWSVELFHEAR